jgi:hypothetical protein
MFCGSVRLGRRNGDVEAERGSARPHSISFTAGPSYPGNSRSPGQAGGSGDTGVRRGCSSQELPENWAVGQRAEVFIETDRRDDVLTIPLSTLSRRDEQEGVFVAADGYCSLESRDARCSGTRIC